MTWTSGLLDDLENTSRRADSTATSTSSEEASRGLPLIAFFMTESRGESFEYVAP